MQMGDDRRWGGVASALRLTAPARPAVFQGEASSCCEVVTLLRAKASKDGDAEPRDYGDASR